VGVTFCLPYTFHVAFSVFDVAFSAETSNMKTSIEMMQRQMSEVEIYVYICACIY
jgi:hypothetical protein